MALLPHITFDLQAAPIDAITIMNICRMRLLISHPNDFPYRSFSFGTNNITFGFATQNDAQTFINHSHALASEDSRFEDFMQGYVQYGLQARDLLMEFAVDPIAFANLRQAAVAAQREPFVFFASGRNGASAIGARVRWRAIQGRVTRYALSQRSRASPRPAKNESAIGYIKCRPISSKRMRGTTQGMISLRY
jgi:hypothetical protein